MMTFGHCGCMERAALVYLKMFFFVPRKTQHTSLERGRKHFMSFTKTSHFYSEIFCFVPVCILSTVYSIPVFSLPSSVRPTLFKVALHLISESLKKSQMIPFFYVLQVHFWVCQIWMAPTEALGGEVFISFLHLHSF